MTNPAFQPKSADRSHHGEAPTSLPSRRAILRTGALGGVALASLAAFGWVEAQEAGGRDDKTTGASERSKVSSALDIDGWGTYNFNQDWLFGGVYVAGAERASYDDSGFVSVTLPHTVTPLSWGDWDHTAWENVWIYRKHFDVSAVSGGRVFADFDGVMTNAAVVVNGVTVATHKGGYLPWSAELTRHLVTGDNVLAVIVDARWLDVPPDNPAGGVSSVDYLQPGGIYRDVALRVVPEAFIADVFAKPLDVLTSDPSVEILATIDAARVPRGPVRLTAELLDGSRRLASAAVTAKITAVGTTVVKFGMTNVGDITLWSPETPQLYTIRTTLSDTGGQAHAYQVRMGFREARFELDGFYLNGKRLEIFGLNRHQLFPYLGMAAPARLQRRDAEILKNELNCNMVRCSHYPQS
ncbi:MAG TPA: glycoside hydrolase family 2 TIM barrel-domain containing protein, partial [Streptosporangiaceae bacterium]|nr:glycoside hydrolase family 2 TIM barrel-domain containing protein [Streptosporangiaceae bacterium]